MVLGEIYADKETMREAFSKILISVNDGCSKITDAKVKCKGIRLDHEYCDGNRLLDSLFLKMYTTWEQNEQCKNIDYYDRAGKNLKKLSGWVYNITSNWTTYFDSKSNLIIKQGKGTFICQFAAKRYMQIRDTNFFHGSWKPSAVKCSNFIADVRRGMMCSLCDLDEQKNFFNATNTSRPRINMNFRMCNDFAEACLDYIRNKQLFLDKLNVVFTLGLCDKEGQYLAQNTKTYYKKVLPSEVVYDEENVEWCQGHIKKDLSVSDEIKVRNEKSCHHLCEKYFGQSTMIADDLNTFDNLHYMHDILEEIVNDNFHPNLFIARTGPVSTIMLDFKEINYTFNPSSEAGGLNLERHMRDNNYKEFNAANYLKNGLISFFAVCLIFAISVVIH